ncbi:MAG: hypothetical protein AB1499_01270 [Nitrospirota bacterium]
MDNKIKIYISAPFLLAMVLSIAAAQIDVPFKKGIPEIANRIASFTPAGLTIKQKPPVYPGPDLKSVMDFDHPSPVSTSLPPVDRVRQKTDSVRGLSLVIISGQDKTAVINGVPVKEGDKIADMKILKIETDRVLLKNKTLTWMHLE